MVGLGKMSNSRVPSHIKPSDTLLLKQVPANANNIPMLIKHFKKCGRIQSVWCSGTTAQITFEKEEDTKTAFESPEAYANNRFVKFWYHQGPERPNSKLSEIADMARIDAALDEVSRDEVKKHEIPALQKEIDSLAAQIKTASDDMKASLNEKMERLKDELAQFQALLE